MEHGNFWVIDVDFGLGTKKNVVKILGEIS